MLKDIHYAVRILLRAKAWTAMVVLSLALGIGANTALFSAVNGLALRTLPVDDPGSLVRFRHVGRNEMSQNVSEYGAMARPGDTPVGTTFSYPIFRELRQRQPDAARSRRGRAQFTGQCGGRRQGARSHRLYIASGNFLDLLGVRAALGRPMRPTTTSRRRRRSRSSAMGSGPAASGAIPASSARSST